MVRAPSACCVRKELSCECDADRFIAAWLGVCLLPQSAVRAPCWGHSCLMEKSSSWEGGVSGSCCLKKERERESEREKTPPSPQAGIGGGDGGHVVLAILPSVTVWMRAFCSYPIMPGMLLATGVISAICRSWCRSAKGLADGTLFLGVCVFGF